LLTSATPDSAPPSLRVTSKAVPQRTDSVLPLTTFRLASQTSRLTSRTSDHDVRTSRVPALTTSVHLSFSFAPCTVTW